eukprot:CAMPEP_0172163540 /NCGR_PEP_ID=MMETSP1050-20130122/7329_1 /TAXON_ID=233186 /ORGANISM="Cryptomonas curvata, Strain CCAP979/52" /LENGTH=254 /DNA_ID=CAMNT_0012833743 /DNA_START=176 /DNA_END=940 /DNA_ORIENTATION=+
MRDPIGPGMDWNGAWKSWVAKDAIKPMNMQGCRPPAHALDAARDNPVLTTTLGGHNARHVYGESHYQRYDPKEAPSDRTKEPAKVFEAARSTVRHDPLTAYYPPPDTQLPVHPPPQEPDRWVPMNHTRLSSLYDPVTHQRTDVLKVKPAGQPREAQDVVTSVKRGDASRAPGNYVSSAAVLQHDPTAFRRRKGVTEFYDATHPCKPNLSLNYASRIATDPSVFARRQGGMVAWMHAAIIGKSKIPFRKTQPPGV